MTGFTDIEVDRKTLHQSPFDLVNRSDVKNKVAFEAKQSFYIWAERQAEEARFKDPVDAKIWHHLSQGDSIRSMQKLIGLDYSWISRKVKKIERYIKAQEVGSGSSQLDLMFWSEPWNYTG